MASCLLLVDLQDGFLNSNTSKIYNKIGKLLIENAANWDFIVASQFTSIPGGFYDLPEELEGLQPYVEFAGMRTFRKSGYSCLTDELLEFLVDNNITKVTVVGVDTDACVMQTAFDLHDKGIPFEVLSEYCASTEGVYYHSAAIMLMRRNLGIENIII